MLLYEQQLTEYLLRNRKLTEIHERWSIDKTIIKSYLNKKKEFLHML